MSKENVKKIVSSLLSSYLPAQRLLRSQEYAKEFFDPDDNHEISHKTEIEEKLDLIESLVELLGVSDEYTVVHLHYIKGLSVDKCAESMCISRTTAYRLLGKAYKRIYDKLNKTSSTEKGGAE